MPQSLFGTKEEARLWIRIISFILIGLAIISMFAVIVEFVSGGLYDQALIAIESSEGITLDANNFAQGMAIGILVIAIILNLVEIYVGYKGLREANGVKQGKGYLVLVTIYLVLTAISFVCVLINAIRTPGGVDDWASFFSPLADALLAFCFLGSVKTLRASDKK